MDALFDSNGNHVGWIQPGNHIFDTDLTWVAYIAGGQAWSAATGVWLGPVDGLNCLDRNGLLVAWNPKQPMKGRLATLEPYPVERPAAPPLPVRPIKPAKINVMNQPQGGWSTLRWKRWLAQ